MIKTDLTQANAELKRQVLKYLIPAFREKDIVEMTGLSASTIGYYRRTDKITTYQTKHKQYIEIAMADIEDTEIKNREYAADMVMDMLQRNGMSYG